MRIGLVGAGMVSAFHVAGWQACSNAILVGIADPDLVRAAARAALVPGAAAFTSLAEMAAGCDLDAVDIVAPPHLHADLVLQALALGLHVLCQKPLAPDAAQAADLVRKMPDTPRVMVHENWRWRAPYRAMKADLVSGALSYPDQFDMRVQSAGLLPDAKGRYPALVRQPFFAGLDRFLVTEVLVHHLDTLQFLFGPLRVHDAKVTRRCPVIIGEDYAEITMTAGTCKGRLIGDFCVPDAPSLPSDLLVIPGGCIDGWSYQIDSDPPTEWDRQTAYQQSYSDTILHFVTALRSGAEFETDPQTAMGVLEQVSDIYSIARTH